MTPHPLHITSVVREVKIPILCQSCGAATVDKEGDVHPMCIVKAANRSGIANDMSRRRITIVGFILAAALLLVFVASAMKGI